MLKPYFIINIINNTSNPFIAIVYLVATRHFLIMIVFSLRYNEYK